MPTAYDVIVVGAGPAGSAAALKLGEAGLRVAILEKKKLPRPKICGGGVSYRTRELLVTDISSVVERESYSARISLLQRNLSFDVSRDSPLISMTTRASFDQLLVSTAQLAGAKIMEQTEVRSVSASNNHVNLQTTSGPVKARFAIAADGAISRVAKTAGWRESRLLVPAIEAELYFSDKEMALYSRAARFDFDTALHGYAWIFPKKDHLSTGILNIRRGKEILRPLFFSYLDRIGIRGIQKREIHGAVIPMRPRQDGFVRNRVFLVGDSAGFTDPVTAEGIFFAIQSGQLAASALLTASLGPRRAVSLYEKAVQRTILPEIAAGRILARVLHFSPRLRTWIFRRQGERLANAVADVVMGKRTYRKLLTDPRNYLKLLGH